MSTLELGSDLLDQQELLQLALYACHKDQIGSAMVYLKIATARPAPDVRAHQLLGSLYAQIGMHERAANQMEAMLAMAPDFALGRLQLGVLYLTMGLTQKALESIPPLLQLDDSDAHRAFGEGLEHLCHDRLIEAGEVLQRGIELNKTNPALNDDMNKILSQIARHTAPQEGAQPEVPHMAQAMYNQNQH